MKTKLIQILIICGSLVACSTDYSAVYQSVNAESKWDETAKLVINNSENELPLYEVREGSLYLMVQMKRVEQYFRTVVIYPAWDRVEISNLLELHPDIKALMPADWNNWLPKGYGDECKGKQ